jgi:hypothetical protein
MHSADLQALVKGGHVAVIRHGNAPPGYGGAPPGLRFDDCKTQRNLDDIGRGQARALGEAFRNHGVRVDRIVSSPVCRCLEGDGQPRARADALRAPLIAGVGRTGTQAPDPP